MKTQISLVLVMISLALCIAAPLSEGMKEHINPKMFKNTPAESYPAPRAEAAGPLRVHVVAHSHDDVGWLKTPDEYYYGSNQSIQDAGVQYIIDTVIDELTHDPSRKFIYVEMAFFWRWWSEQNDATKKIVKQLVKNGQLEFINGGWTMHDEATTFYEDMIDQMTLGHQFLNDNFGVMPKVGWQIDPFGHSSTSAYIDIEIGFEALFFARLDYQYWNYVLPQRGLEMEWTPIASMPSKSLLTGMMYGSYCNPGGFMFEYGGDNTPIMDDPNLEDYNLEQRVQDMLTQFRAQANVMKHGNDIMVSWGCDFMYENAHMMFKNIEKLMKYVNANPSLNVTMFYSTPSQYYESIMAQNVSWPEKSDDFFPYADGPHAYWTGYFTSRPALKGYVRERNNFLQATTQLYSTSGFKDSASREQLFKFQEPMGVLTHHDAVAGTEQQHVANDYARRLSDGSVSAEALVIKAINQAIGGKTAPNFQFCPLLNQSTCPGTDALSQNQAISVVVYNPLAWARVEYITLPIPVSTVSVADFNGKVVASQVSKFGSPYSVTFAATAPPFGFATYFVTPGSSEGSIPTTTSYPAAPFSLSNDIISVALDEKGDFVSITNKISGKTVTLQQSYQYYMSSTGTKEDGQASGAYIFRPVNSTTYPFGSTNPSVVYNNGTLVSEVRRTFSASCSQIIRLYAGQDHVEVVDIIGPIDVSDGVGKEVISKFTTDIATSGTFFTDSNGIEVLTRKINYRPSWPLQVTEPVSGNYYPINSLAYIKDPVKDVQFTMLIDRSRGGGSWVDGELEGMLHRATVADDGRGVGEPINEHNEIISTTWLIVDSASGSSARYRPSAKRLAHPFVLAFASTPSVAAWSAQYKTQYSPITAPVPNNIQFLTLAPTMTPDKYIMRFHHIFQMGEDTNMTQPVTIDINSYYAGHQIQTVTETQLTAVQKATRPDAVLFSLSEAARASGVRTPAPVTLQPLEIRTFLVTFESTLPHMTHPHQSISIVV